MKINFSSNDDLALNKQLKFINLTIIVRTVFEEECNYYSQMSVYMNHKNVTV